MRLPGRSARMPAESFSMSSVKSGVTLGSQIKADDKGLVVLPTDRLFQKLDSRFLLELEATAHRLAGVDQQTDLQGQIRLAAEAEDLFRRLAVVQNFEIVFLQILDVVAVLVGDGENQVDFVHGLAHGEDRFTGSVGALEPGRFAAAFCDCSVRAEATIAAPLWAGLVTDA